MGRRVSACQDSIKTHLCLKAVQYLVAASNPADFRCDRTNDSIGDIDFSTWVVEPDGDFHVRSPIDAVTLIHEHGMSIPMIDWHMMGCAALYVFRLISPKFVDGNHVKVVFIAIPDQFT